MVSPSHALCYPGGTSTFKLRLVDFARYIVGYFWCRMTVRLYSPVRVLCSSGKAGKRNVAICPLCLLDQALSNLPDMRKTQDCWVSLKHESHYLQWELTCTFLDSLTFPGQNNGTVVNSPQPFCVLWSPHLAGWKADRAWAVWASPLQESPCSAS